MKTISDYMYPSRRLVAMARVTLPLVLPLTAAVVPDPAQAGIIDTFDDLDYAGWTAEYGNWTASQGRLFNDPYIDGARVMWTDIGAIMGDFMFTGDVRLITPDGSSAMLGIGFDSGIDRIGPGPNQESYQWWFGGTTGSLNSGTLQSKVNLHHNGTNTDLTPDLWVSNYDPYAWHAFEVRREGDMLYGSLDGSQIFSVNDATLPFGYLGFHTQGQWQMDNVGITPVPEPGTLGMLVAGFGAMSLLRRRKR